MEAVTVKAWQDDEISVMPQDNEKEIRIVFTTDSIHFSSFTWLTIEQALELAAALEKAAKGDSDE